jgi:drug/metabolite transporter (DMT)-like permease
VLTYALAVLAACANGLSSVLQRKANKRVPQRESLSPRLLWRLLHEPVWLCGIGALTAGFLLQASALGTGQLSLVEPVLVLELPVALVLSARVFRHRLGPAEWLPAAGMTAGLGGLLFLLAPASGTGVHVPWYLWLAGIGANLALVGGLTAWARSRPAGQPGGPPGGQRHGRPTGVLRAALLAIAAGSAFGLAAALMKAMTIALARGHLLTSWPVYAMVAAGALGMFLTQSALNAGQLIATQPGLTLSDPLVSVLWGVMIFHERVRLGWYVLGELACAAVIVAAVVALARSPLLSGSEEAGDASDTGRDRAPAAAGEAA